MLHRAPHLFDVYVTDSTEWIDMVIMVTLHYCQITNTAKIFDRKIHVILFESHGKHLN